MKKFARHTTISNIENRVLTENWIETKLKNIPIYRNYIYWALGSKFNDYILFKDKCIYENNISGYLAKFTKGSQAHQII